MMITNFPRAAQQAASEYPIDTPDRSSTSHGVLVGPGWCSSESSRKNLVDPEEKGPYDFFFAQVHAARLAVMVRIFDRLEETALEPNGPVPLVVFTRRAF